VRERNGIRVFGNCLPSLEFARNHGTPQTFSGPLPYGPQRSRAHRRTRKATPDYPSHPHRTQEKHDASEQQDDGLQESREHRAVGTREQDDKEEADRSQDEHGQEPSEEREKPSHRVP
jgi:hypothetical protein